MATEKTTKAPAAKKAAQSEPKRSRRKNRTKKEIAQERLDAEISKQQKVYDKAESLDQEAKSLREKGQQMQARIDFLRQDPDLHEPVKTETAEGDEPTWAAAK